MRKILSLITAVFLLSGCYKISIERPVNSQQSLELRQHFFVFGLLGESTVDVSRECPRGAARFGDSFTFTDVVLAVVTVGIYTPRTVVIECAA